MFPYTSLPQLERRLRSDNYKLCYNASLEEVITSEVCPTCNVLLKYIGYATVHRQRAFMYCNQCRYWEEY